MSRGTLELLQEWAEQAQDPSSDGLVFPSEKITTPLSLDNLRRRNRAYPTALGQLKSARSARGRQNGRLYGKPESDPVIRRVNKILFGAQVPLGGLNRGMSQQQLDLF